MLLPISGQNWRMNNGIWLIDGAMMWHDNVGRYLVNCLMPWLFLWALGGLWQLMVTMYFNNAGRELSEEELAKTHQEPFFVRIRLPWYLRPLFGYLPLPGLVAVRAGILQAMAILCVGLDCILATYFDHFGRKSMDDVLSIFYVVVSAAISMWLNQPYWKEGGD